MYEFKTRTGTLFMLTIPILSLPVAMWGRGSLFANLFDLQILELFPKAMQRISHDP